SRAGLPVAMDFPTRQSVVRATAEDRSPGRNLELGDVLGGTVRRDRSRLVNAPSGISDYV
ncbi:MAG: hypothetical protein AAGJ53_05230, partial [Pseudomonadota bacterium]